MRMMRPVIWLTRDGKSTGDENIKDFRPANLIEQTEETVPESDEEADPKASSATERAPDSDSGTNGSSTPGSEGSPETPPTNQSANPETPASAVKAKLLHPSTTKSGKSEPPAGE